MNVTFGSSTVRCAGAVLPAPPRERIPLPTLAAPPARSGFPLVATLAPVVVSVVLWMLTRSIYSLLFAFLGPVVALGGVVDGRVNRRRAARREHGRFLGAVTRTADAIGAAHDRERERLARLSPDPGATPAWATAAGADSRGQPLALRVATAALAGRVDLVGDDPDEPGTELADAIRGLRDAGGDLRDAPLVVDARDGIGVIGPPVPASAVARALAVRLTARLSPAEVTFNAPPSETWVRDLPHAVSIGGPGRYVWREGGGEAEGEDEGDPIGVSWAEREADLPAGCGILLSVGAEGELGGERAGERARDLRPLAMTVAEAAATVAGWRGLAEARGLRPSGSELPARVLLGDLLASTGNPDPGSLSAVVGQDAEGAVELDLVAHGPHAVIAGTTGSGKSELLVSWILGMAAGRSPADVAFLLIDFKGGSAFAPLAVLPHVLATLSDLDARLTRRAIESLRAELLHRERTLAEAGARSISDLPAGTLPRLVIVVDEFAAVVSASPELHEVFGDLAARGRSLGLHLILCTQRPAGVIRDAVLANATLRVSLRVTDRADSVAMLGTDAASRLPAEPRGRGILAGAGTAASAASAEPRTVQFAIAGVEDATRLAAESPRSTVRRPWCPPLPTVLNLDALPPAGHGLPFGLADLPAEQRQPVAAHDPDRHGHLLVVGGAGAGSTTALATLAVSASRAGMPVCVVPALPADAWAVLSTHAEAPGAETSGASPESSRRALVLIDDLDALVARFDADHRPEFLELLTTLARGGGPDGATGPTLAVSAHRLTGPIASIAGLFGSRLLLRQPAREEHVLAGGDPRFFDPDLPAGSGFWRGVVVQVARATDAARAANWVARVPDLPRVTPAAHAMLAVVATRPRAVLERLRVTGARVVELGGGSTPSPDDLQVSRGAVPTVLLGDPEAWLADWALLTRARREWPTVLLGVGPPDVRALMRDHAMPPPLGPDPAECWLSTDGRIVRAVLALP